MSGENLLMKNRVLISKDLFDKFYTLISEFQYRKVADIMSRLSATISQTEGGLLMAPVFLEDACNIIADNVAYSKCAPVMVPISQLLQAHYIKTKADAEATSDPDSKPEPEPEPEPDNNSES